ncbi:ornithine cyclodeaminase family protein [Nocardioides sp. HDW12B]|uniref:ornithine cyclodeaminase family protein n=1 Tax=Nocardioides sp. HDW12B TaxID=2714939 RepID=UPI00140A7BC7|nr:ornithine cyclodeaminase family protein [Nocardioides sp. HDW12B]QIK68105.1 ornithine cyclodeaminase family protein [Nocardioides sp. HDW12B]
METPTGPALVDALRLTPRGAVDALEDALRSGFDPEDDPPRSRVATAAGELLLMPSTLGDVSGVKLLSLTGDNPQRDLPVVQGAYLLFEGPGQRPAALVDGAALTDLRTSAVSALAVRHLLPRSDDRPLRLVVLGAGPQARAHVTTLRTLHDLASVTLVGRAPDTVAALAQELGAAVGDVSAVAEADVVCCCTSATTPLFDGDLVRDDAVVVAIGSHHPGARETDDVLVRRSAVVVESRRSALAEAGDVVLPIDAGVLDVADLVTLREVVTGAVVLPEGRPRLFKGTGMSWQDLVVAAAELHARRT